MFDLTYVQHWISELGPAEQWKLSKQASGFPE